MAVGRASGRRRRRRGAWCTSAGVCAVGFDVAAVAADARIWVNMPDHANIAAHEMVSNRARLMVADTNSVIETTSQTVAIPVPIAIRLPRRWKRNGALSSRARNPRTIEPATLS